MTTRSRYPGRSGRRLVVEDNVDARIDNGGFFEQLSHFYPHEHQTNLLLNGGIRIETPDP